MEVEEVESLNKKIDDMIVFQPISAISCEVCRGDHVSQGCNVISVSPKEFALVDYLGNAQRLSISFVRMRILR